MVFDVQVIARALPYLAKGLAYSLELTAMAGAGGLALGTLLALLRLNSSRLLGRCVRLYVDLVRSVPLILVLFWFYFLAPVMLQALLQAPRPVTVSADVSALCTFVMFEAAYFSEIIRSGIQSVGAMQLNAARALGLSAAQAFRHVVLPQALRAVLPLILTQLIVLFQDTSLVYVLSLNDFVGAASKVAQRDSRLVEMYTFVALVFLVICSVLSVGVRTLRVNLLPAR